MGPIFKHKDQNLYLIANLKVMFSNLKSQSSLNEVSKDFSLFLDVLNGRFNSDIKFYLIVRNPYHRLESFFKNKLRSRLNYIEETGDWQNCHAIFFKYLNLSKSDSASTIVSKFSSLTFPEFIELLPKIYAKDAHIYPQYWAQDFHVRWNQHRIGIPINLASIFKLESEADLQQMEKVFELDLSTKVNSSNNNHEFIRWTFKEYEIVNSLYKKDFEHFGYNMLEK